MKALPERGRIGIFTAGLSRRRVSGEGHPEWLDQKQTKGKSDKDFWRDRYEDINNFEGT